MTELARQRGATIVKLGAQYDALDEPTMAELSRQLNAAALQSDPPVVIVDFSQTGYVGSSFIEELVRTWKQLKQREGTFALCSLGTFCADVFRIAKLDQLWPCYDSVSEALDALSPDS